MTRRTSGRWMCLHSCVVLALLLVGQLVGPIWGAGSEGRVQAAQAGGGLIAYVGEDQNIWVMNADGSDPRQVTTNGERDTPSIRPAWSHDGTMLAFSNYGNGEGSGDGIWVVRDGTIRKLPNTERCTGPAFSADNTRVLYGCANGREDHSSKEPPSDLATNPARGFISSSALDGSDQRIEIPYTTHGDIPAWENFQFVISPDQVDVNPVTGEILATYSHLHLRGMYRFSADGVFLNKIELGEAGEMGPWSAHFMPDGQSMLVTTCVGGCQGNDPSPQTHIVVQLDLEGNQIGEWSTPSSSFSNGVSPAPDGKQAVVSLGDDLTLYRIDSEGGATSIGVGANPAWQPVGEVFTLPDGSQVGGGASEGSGQGNTEVPSTPVPSAAARTGASTTSGGGLIAYVGTDGNIWTIGVDGSNPTQVTTDGVAKSWRGTTTYHNPSWSHDGSMLVFTGAIAGEGDVPFLWRDGTVSQIPSVTNCNAAAFLPGDTRLAFTCGDIRDSQLSDGELKGDPRSGMVTVANLDGSDIYVLTPYSSSPGGMLVRSWSLGIALGVSVTNDGTIVVSGVLNNSSRSRYTQLINPDGSFGSTIYSPERGNLSVTVDAGGTTLLGTLCRGCYRDSTDPANTSIIRVGTDGAILDSLVTLPSDELVRGVDRSPDGSTLVYSSTTNYTGLDLGTVTGPYPIRMIDIASGQVSDLGVEGFDVVWQPAPVDATVPTTADGTKRSAAPTAATTTTTGQGQTRGTGDAVSAVPTAGQLVFSAKDGGQWNLYLHDFNTGQNRQLTDEPGDEWAPAFSHDGTRLAYLSDQSGTNQVWIMNPDGTNPVQVSFWDGSDQITYVDWSSNNRMLYITMQADTIKYVLQMPVSGGTMTAFLDGSAARPQVTSDGTCFFITDNEGLTRIAITTEANPANSQISQPGDALLLDPSGTYGVYQIGDPGATDNRRLGILGIGRPASIVAPGSGYDDSDPVITGATTADHILWVVDNGTTISIWSSNVTDNAGSLVTGAVDTGYHDSIWYIAWRPDPGTGVRPGA